MTEITEPTFTYRPNTFVSYGLPYATLLQTHLDRLGAQRVYVFVSGSLAKNHPAQPESVRALLGSRIVGEKVGVVPHTEWSELFQIREQTAQLKPDAFVVLGGGSACDIAKLLALVDANPPDDGEYTHEYLTRLYGVAGMAMFLENRPAVANAPKIPVICIPTTLSAAEYTPFSGATDERTGLKKQFYHPQLAPRVVILDGALAQLTPRWIWLETGVRAIDHCVETLCSPLADGDADVVASDGLRGLVAGLLGSASGADTPQDRLAAHLGARSAVSAACRGVLVGASHAIGHMLGPLGVAHGHTSCVMLPFVCRYNKPVNEEKQRKAAEAIWNSSELARGALEKRGLSSGHADLCGVLDALIRELGMPRSLSEVGVTEAQFERLAELVLDDRMAGTNPRPLTTKAQVLEILRMAA